LLILVWHVLDNLKTRSGNVISFCACLISLGSNFQYVAFTSREFKNCWLELFLNRKFRTSFQCDFHNFFRDLFRNSLLLAAILFISSVWFSKIIAFCFDVLIVRFLIVILIWYLYILVYFEIFQQLSTDWFRGYFIYWTTHVERFSVIGINFLHNA